MTRPRILIVDDVLLNVTLLGSALGHEYEIDVALSGEEALARAESNPPGIILLDIVMPDMDGFEVFRRLRQMPSLTDTPVIFITSLDDVREEMVGLGLGAIDYIAKPFRVDLVKLRVRNHLELKQQRDALKEQRDLLSHRTEELEAALARIKTLEGIIPICMYCKNIRATDDSWQQIEQYVIEHSDAHFSHGICPACFERQRETLLALETDKPQ